MQTPSPTSHQSVNYLEKSISFHFLFTTHVAPETSRSVAPANTYICTPSSFSTVPATKQSSASQAFGFHPVCYNVHVSLCPTLLCLLSSSRLTLESGPLDTCATPTAIRLSLIVLLVFDTSRAATLLFWSLQLDFMCLMAEHLHVES
jgi:hypothetical protein